MVAVSVLAALLLPSASATSASSLCLVQQRAQVRNSAMREVWLGNSAPLSEKGYQLVAAEKSDVEMKAFIHRVVEKEARYVKDVAELSGFVPFYSGTQLVQNFETMKHELRNSPWVAEGAGRNAELSEAGYQNVAKLRSKPHMVAFMRRVLDSDFKKVADEGGLNGLVPYYDGEVSVQSFDQLKKELLSAPWAVSRDSVDVLLPSSAPQVSLSEQKPAKASEGCDDWCSSDLFVKVEANVTVTKNLSSWVMKCGWAHCSGCSTCNDPSTLMAVHDQYKRDVSEHGRSGKSASCDDWCSSEVFQAVKQNVTSVKEFSWAAKCEWQNCGGCSKCTAHVDAVNMRATGSASTLKASEDPEEEEPVETTLATTTTAATTTVATTTLATTTLATTTLATTTLATTTLATTTLATTTLATTTLPTTTIPEEEEEVEEVVELVEEAEEAEPVESTNSKDEKDQPEKKHAEEHADKKNEKSNDASHKKEVKEHSQEHAEKEKGEDDKKDVSETKGNKQEAKKDKEGSHKKKKGAKPAKEEKDGNDSEDTNDEPKKKGPLSWLFR